MDTGVRARSWQRLPRARRRSRKASRISAAALTLAALALFGVGGAPAATNGTLNEPTTPILDDFNNRGLEDPLYQWGNWASASIDGGGQTLEIIGGGAGHNEGESTDADSYRAADVTGTAEAYATIAAVPDNNQDMYVYLNLQQTGTPGWDGYRARWFHWISVDGLYLEKVENGLATSMVPPVQLDPAVGDTILIRNNGGTLELWHKSGGTWILRLSAADGSFQGGKIGLGSNDDKGRWDDFGGSGSTTPPPTAPPVPATGLLDQFERPNEDPLSQGGAWSSTPLFGTGETLEVLGNAAGENEGEVVQANSFRAAEITGDAEVHARIANMPNNNQEFYLYLHLQEAGTAGVDGYRARWFHWISTDGLYIQKITNGLATTIAGPLSLDPATGDTLLLRRFGLALELWRKNGVTWTKLLSTLDGDYTSGRLGLGMDDDDGKWDDFGGGAIGAPPPSTTLTVAKTVVNDNGGSATSSNWTINVAGPTPLSFPGAASPGTSNPVDPGAYKVTESGGPAGYTLSYSGDCDADGDLTLALGQTKTCVLTNDDPVPAGSPPETQTYGTNTSGCGVNGCGGTSLFADPVNSRTGAFTTSVDDLDLPGTGVSFTWSRSYTSADATVGRLGPGWADSYSASLAVQPNGDVRLHGEDGQQLYYTKQGDGSFVGASGSLSTLNSVTGGYELLRTDQVKYRFDTAGRLLSIKDRNDQGVTLAYDGQNRLTTVTDAANRQATITYNLSNLVSLVQTQDGRNVGYGYTGGRLTTVTDVRAKTWTYAYDADGRLEKITDPLTHAQVTNVYGAGGRVQSQTDALSKTTTFAWNASTETATATDANQKVWTHDYEDGVLVEEVDPLTNDTDLVRDDDFNTTQVTGPTNETTTMTYDPAGNMLTATPPPSLGSAQKTFVYNARNDVELVTDARGKVTDYAYNPTTGNLTSVTQDSVQVASYTYLPDGQVQTFTDGNEKTTTYTYTANGYLASSSDPLGNKATYTYDGAGRVATRVDPKGNVPGCSCAADFTWTYTYNPAGQPLTETDPLNHTTTNVYDDAGRLQSSSDASNRTTSYTYDDANRVLTETAPDPDGGGPLLAPVTSSTYDSVGNKLTETDPRGNTTTFAYDSANRLSSTTGPDPDGAGPLTAPVTTHTYDPNGNLASVVEPRGNVSGASPDDFRTAYTYDAAGRMLTETRPDPDGGGSAISPKTTNVYDPVGNIASVKDGNDHLTAYTYDAAGRILTVTAPDLGVTTYTHDDAGNVLTRKDDNNHTTTSAYDAASRLASETSPDPDGPGPLGPAVTSYTYDPNGNRLTLTDPNGNATGTVGDGQTTYAYDRANRLTSINYSDSTQDVTFSYDNVGNRLTMADGSGSETRAYDNLDRLTSVTRATNTFSYVYDAASNITRRTYPGGTVADYAYDPLNRLASVASTGQQTGYGYDPASNHTSTTLPAGNGYVETRAYDRAGRLTEVNNQKGATVLSRFVSTLDSVGNPTQVVRTGSLPQTQTYTYDASDRITSVCFQAGACPGASDPSIRWTYDKVGNRLSEQRPGVATTTYNYDFRDRLTSAGSTSYSYDQNGNELSAGSRTFAYDLANRLKTTSQGNTTTTYSYDGDGVRLQASTGSQASKKTNFLWDVNGGLPQVALERDGNNNPLRRYLYGARRISMTAGSSTSYYLSDGLGSAANLTSSSGATQWTWSYEPFGSIRTEQNASGNQPDNLMKFTGEYLDPTGLYHLRARQHDPSSGRFLQIDPIETAPGDHAGSAYAYAADRPTVMTDPTGMTLRNPNEGQFIAMVASSGSDASGERNASFFRAGEICLSGFASARFVNDSQFRWGVYINLEWCWEGSNITRADYSFEDRVGPIIKRCRFLSTNCSRYYWEFEDIRARTSGGVGRSFFRVRLDYSATNSVAVTVFNEGDVARVATCNGYAAFNVEAGDWRIRRTFVPKCKGLIDEEVGG